MRIAAISDIHGNLRALEAVLADVAAHAPDLILNLGDTISGPLEAGETADLLIARGFPTVRGNHDRHLIHPPAGGMGKSDRMAHRHLLPRHLDWLAGLPAALRPLPDVLAVHGRPGDDLEFLLEDPHREYGLVRSPVAAVTARLGDASGLTLVLCGHSHLPGCAAVPGGPLVVNPGSVGLQAYEDDDPFLYRVSAGSPHARYAVLDQTARGWDVTWRAVAYDWDAAAAAARQVGRRAWVAPLATGHAD